MTARAPHGESMLPGPALGNLEEPLTGRRWQPEDTMREVAARMRLFEQRGVQPGDRVFMHYGNTAGFFADLLAVWALGGCAVPIDARLTGFEIGNIAAAARPRLSLVDHTTAPELITALRCLGVAIAEADEAVGHDTAPARDSLQGEWPRLDDDALILFTSGTTGDPKGAVLTHRALRARWMALRDAIGVASYRRALCMLPTQFVHGLVGNALYPWLSGNDLVVTPAGDSRLLMQLGPFIDEHRITFFSSVPSMWALILKTSPPPRGGTLKRVHCSSAPLTAHLWQQMQAWAGTREVFNIWGGTEMAGHIVGTTLPDFVPQDGLIGAPWGAQLWISHTSEPAGLFEAGASCGVGETGHVWVNTPSLMRGYLDQPELTQLCVTRGWYCSGDVGYIDERGALYIKGRDRDEINKGGTKIHPADIDAVAQRHAAVVDACAFGVPDSRYGQDVALAVVLDPADDGIILALHAWLKQHLADFKMPRRWYLVDAIPRNIRGKVNRRQVMELCAQRMPLDLQRALRATNTQRTGK